MNECARFLLIALFALCGAAGPWAASMAGAQGLASPTGTDPADGYLLSADALDYDQPADVVTARGNVEIAGPGLIINGNEMRVDNKNNLIDVVSPIAITETGSGNVFFAEEAHISKDFKDGFARNVGLLAPDKTRLAAARARRSDGKFTVYDKGVFSPCDLCETNPREPPLWQLRAAKTTHDHENKDLIHRDVTLEMAGIPVFYTPYMSHPDPTVKRRSGFLAPSMGRNGDIGFFTRTPYYYTFGPDLDYTATPVFSGQDGVRWLGQVRDRFEHGELKIDHSLAVAERQDEDGTTKKGQIRGHLNGFIKYNIDSEYRTGADFAMLTDKNYLRRYSESTDDILTNRAYLERFKGRSFGALETYYFQDNRPGARPEQPLVMPRLRYSAYGEPDATLGGRWSIDGILSALDRDADTDSRKLGVDAGWQRRDVLPLGFVSTLDGHVRQDFYWVDQHTDPAFPGATYNNDFSTRLFPQGQAKISFPLAAAYNGFSHTLEPIAAFTAAPVQTYNPRIPNEDSQDVEFDTTNLFDLSRYNGTDRMEQGSRLTYGFKTGFYADQGSYGEFTFGQSFRLTSDPQFPAGSGLDTDHSDYVGQVKLETLRFKYPSIMRFDYQFRLDKDATNFRRHDIRAIAGVPEFTPSVTYTYLDPSPTNTTGIGAVEELRYGFSTTINKFYTFRADQVRDLRAGTGGPRSTTAALIYSDECFSSSLTFTRDDTVRTGVSSGDTVMFHIYFKHLGGIDSGPK